MEDHRNNAKKPISQWWLIPVLICIGLGSYWLTISMIPQSEPTASTQKKPTQNRIRVVHEDLKPSKNGEREPEKPFSPTEPSEPFSNQRAITFSDAEAMRRFLENAGDGVRVLGRIDALDTLLVSFDDLAALDALLDGSEETSRIFPVSIPPIQGPGAQEGAVALENGLLEWLGIQVDHSAFGKGIKIAVLDTGIADHIVFSSEIQRINLVPLPQNSADLNGHGTAVASLIFSNNPLAPGVAPGATPLSIRIADDSGSSNSFLIAQGIIAAVDAGASIINISLGGYGESTLVTKAVEYAKARGSVIVAPSGNTGMPGVMYPASTPGVIAVGAVDAANQYMAFSTTGEQVAISAPGYSINAAYPGDYAARVSGTSFSAPIVTGVIAATMSYYRQQNLTSQQAADLILSNLKDIGVEGADFLTGSGVPDMGSIFHSNTPGYYDASINSIYPLENNQFGVLVQNLGNETLINAGVTVSVNGVQTRANIATLQPGQTRLISVPGGGGTDMVIRSQIKLNSNQADQRGSNDSLDLRFTAQE